MKVDDMADAIISEMHKYNGMLDDELKKIAKDVANEAKREVSNLAPKRTGKYAKSWAVKVTKEKTNSIDIVVHSPTDYRRTHLLEKGHLARNGKRVSPSPTGGHIRPAEEKAIESFEKKAKEAIEKL